MPIDDASQPPPPPPTSSASLTECTFVAPVNIAVIKYWGKRDTELILPTNESISVTLDTADLHTRTTVRLSPEFTQDRFWLNDDGEKDCKISKRMQAVMMRLREMRERQHQQQPPSAPTSLPIWRWHAHIRSRNNFPTAAGLASSASGLACLTVCFAYALGVLDDQSPIDRWEWVSAVARLGSGSACRSLFGGLVKWVSPSNMDIRQLDAASHARQLAPRTHWPELKAVILVIDDGQKSVSSTAGMQTTVATSSLFQHRIKHDVPARVVAMEQVIQTKDFAKFAELTMRDSNQFHAVCLDSWPPIAYLTDTSQRVIRWVHALNDALGQAIVAYTFDAGPNAVLYVEEKNLPVLVAALVKCLPRPLPECNRDLVSMQAGTCPAINQPPFPVNAVRRIICTGIGDGPKRDTSGRSLFD